VSPVFFDRALETAAEMTDDNLLKNNDKAIPNSVIDNDDERSSSLIDIHPELLDRTKYRFIKRTPIRSNTKLNDIWVTTSRPTKIFFNRCVKLFSEKKQNEINLHALGAAIPVAVDLALQLQCRIPLSYSSLNQRQFNSPDNLIAANALDPLQLQLSWVGELTVSVRTYTCTLIDDYEPLQPGLPLLTQQRNNSAISICIRKASAQHTQSAPYDITQTNNQTEGQRINPLLSKLPFIPAEKRMSTNSRIGGMGPKTKKPKLG